jgi:tetratricopeptide (TPR) repeat protein
MDNPDYVLYECLLKQLHALIANGRGEFEDAEQIREQMDAPWHQLTEAEQIRLSGLSADLYQLQDAESLRHVHTPLSQAQLWDRIREAQAWNDWDGVLGLLRQRDPEIPPEAVAFSRTRAYDSLGQSDTALLFLDRAFRHNANDPQYAALRLMLRCRAGHIPEAAVEARELLSTRKNAAPFLLITAADVVLQSIQAASDSEKAEACHQILDSLRPVLAKRGTRESVPADYFVVGQAIRAWCFSQLGQHHECVAALNLAVEADPGDQMLRSIRDLASHDLDSPRRTSALGEALEHRRDVLRRHWPDRLAA